MGMRLSGLLATLGLVGAVPASLGVAYLGYRSGFYPYAGIPVVVGAVLLVVFASLFAVLPRLRAREERRLDQRRVERERGGE